MEQQGSSGKVLEIFSAALFWKTATKEFQRAEGSAVE
jgi:hypothetical protein